MTIDYKFRLIQAISVELHIQKYFVMHVVIVLQNVDEHCPAEKVPVMKPISIVS